MGSSGSKNKDNQSIQILYKNEKFIKGSNPGFLFSNILKTKNATCKIDIGEDVGTGFFVTLPVIKNNLRVCGLVTNNHLISMAELLQGKFFTIIFDANNKQMQIKLDEKRFRFTCPLIDLTFIEFSPEEFDNEIGFLQVNETASTADEFAFIIQHPYGGKCSISQGGIQEIWGFDINHLISTEIGSSGSPLVNNEGLVIGVHKAGMIKENYNKATDIFYLTSAISNFVNNNITSFAITIGNPKKLSFDEIEELSQHGLQATSSPYVFISPSSPHVTTLWFYRANFAWFWTPQEPKSYKLFDLYMCNWTFVDPNFVIKAIGGYYDKVPVAFRNIELIKWLAETGLRFLIQN